MGKHAQIGQGRKAVSVLVATSRRGLSKPLRGQEWRRDLLTSWLFQTCIRLQTSLDRRFLRFGMTVQEASVLLRCVEARRITPGQLAVALGRDKGKVTRFVHRLESSRLLAPRHRSTRPALFLVDRKVMKVNRSGMSKAAKNIPLRESLW